MSQRGRRLHIKNGGGQMIAPCCRVLCRFVLAAITCGWTTGIASAQPPDDPSRAMKPFSVVRDRVPVGDVVRVTDATGATVKGQLAALTDDTVQVNVGADIRSIAAEQVR